MRNALAILLISFICLLALPVFASETLTPTNFQYTASVKGPLKRGVLYKVHLPGEVLTKCSQGCSDIRVFDLNNIEIPYVVIENRISGRTGESYPFEITEYREVGGETFILMKLPEKSGPIGMIRIHTKDRDFKKNVRVYGSRDKKVWELLAGESIFDFSSQVDLRKDEVMFRENDLRYYRLVLSDSRGRGEKKEAMHLKYNGLDLSIDGDMDRKIRIDRLEGITLPPEEKTVYEESVMTGLSSVVDKDRNTVISLETGLPFDRAYFGITNPYYFRKVRTFFSETGREDTFKPLNQYVVFSFPVFESKETRDFLEGGAAGRGFYRFVIENGSNPPVDIRSMKFRWVSRELYFIAQGDSSVYTLAIGNPEVVRPDYDIGHFISQDNWHRHTAEVTEIAALAKNSGYRPLDREKRARLEKVALVSVVVVLVMFMGYWLYSLIRKADTRK